MKRLGPVLLGVAMGWLNTTAPGCAPVRLLVYDAYTGPEMGLASLRDGWRSLPPTQSSLDLAPYKPYPGCAVVYRFPVAVNTQEIPQGRTIPPGWILPPECQPSNFTADGQTWEGM